MNQVSVIGLTPTVDEHSIKVEGTGSAIISDISVELLENSEIFQEIYPDSDKEESDASDDEDDSNKNSEDDAPTASKTELKAVQEKIVVLLDDVKRADEVVSSAVKRLSLLDEYGKKFEPKSGTDVGEIVDVYTEQRGKTFQDHIDGTIRQRELNAEVGRLRTKERKLILQVQKEDNRRVKAAVKKQEAKRKKDQLASARLQKKAAEKARVRREKRKFWPRSCYTVRITLDATHYTPISSRRSSVSSVTDLVKPVVDEPADLASPDPEVPYPACDISISYVTSSAFWSPSYDLQLNTTTNTGTLYFDAQLTNNTSEAWKDCKIILSTSQAVFSGLQDDIPKLVPWRIKLAGKFGGTSHGDITNSTHEVEQRRKYQGASATASQDKQGAYLIGLHVDPREVSQFCFRPPTRCLLPPVTRLLTKVCRRAGILSLPTLPRFHSSREACLVALKVRIWRLGVPKRTRLRSRNIRNTINRSRWNQVRCRNRERAVADCLELPPARPTRLPQPAPEVPSCSAARTPPPRAPWPRRWRPRSASQSPPSNSRSRRWRRRA